MEKRKEEGKVDGRLDRRDAWFARNNEYILEIFGWLGFPYPVKGKARVA